MFAEHVGLYEALKTIGYAQLNSMEGGWQFWNKYARYPEAPRNNE